MNSVLASLMCMILVASQAFAVSGGPVYPGSRNVVGTFAGVMQPNLETNACGSNSLGVFSVGVPQNGLATGAFVMFSQGRVFSGTVRGTADPGRGTLKAVLDATFDFTLTTIVRDELGVPTTITTDITASANGSLNTRITNSGDSTFGVSATRLSGTALLNISQGQVDQSNDPIVSCEMDLTVVGFKQSNTTSSG